MQCALSICRYWNMGTRMVRRFFQSWCIYISVSVSRFPLFASLAPWAGDIHTKPHMLPAKLVVSLTSHRPRFGVLALSLRCLLHQTVRPDHVILWLASGDLAHLPEEVTDLKALGLEIRIFSDIKSYKKILPALDAFPDAYICTADDDLYYWPTWLEELVEGIRGTSGIATCQRAHLIAADEQGRFKPYEQWVINTQLRGECHALFPTSGGGVLYPPGALLHSEEDRQAILSLSPYADDIGMFWVGYKNGLRYKTIGRHRDLIVWQGSQTGGLWEYNWSGGNNRQIHKMAEKYGYPSFTH